MKKANYLHRLRVCRDADKLEAILDEASAELDRKDYLTVLDAAGPAQNRLERDRA